MNETCRRTAWPSEAADCSAARSGSARRTATSVMAEDISLSSWARQASSARNQNSAIGRQMVAAATTSIGLAKKSRRGPVGREHGPHQQGADGKPAARRARRQLEGPARRLLLQSEDQAADGGGIVVGGNLRARRTGRPPLGGTPAALGATGLGVVAAAGLAGLERAEAARGHGRGVVRGVARRQRQLRAAPSALRPRQAPGRARRPRAASFRPEPFPVPISAPRWAPNPLAPTHIPIPGWGTGGQRGKLVIRRRVTGWRG